MSAVLLEVQLSYDVFVSSFLMFQARHVLLLPDPAAFSGSFPNSFSKKIPGNIKIDSVLFFNFDRFLINLCMIL